MADTDRPTDSATLSRELSAFLVQLSTGIHKYGAYPSGHPIIDQAVGSLYSKLMALLSHRESVSLAVARDQLIVDGVATDTGVTVIRDLAQRLHRHQIGVIAFRTGVEPEELVEFLQVVSAEANRQEMPFGLRPIEELERWPHIEVKPFSFDHLEIGEGEAEAHEAGRVSQLWLGLASAAMRRSRSTDAVPEEPGEIAKAINTTRGDHAYDQIITGYLQQLSRELRRREGESASQLQNRVVQLLGALDPDTVARLLSVGGDLASRHDLVADFASSLPVKAVLDLVQAAAKAKQQTISHSLLRMLTKLADHADQGQTIVRSRADETFRSAVNDLLSDWSLEDPNPDTYTQVLDQLSLPSAAEPTQQEENHLSEAPRILQMAVELDVVGAAVVTALGTAVDEGRLDEVVEALDGAPADSAAATQLWTLLGDPALVSRALGHGEAHVDAVEKILQRAGAAAIGPILDALAETDSRTMRHRLLNALTALGEQAGPPTVARLAGAPWYVQRNLLVVLAALPVWPPEFNPEEYARADDARVRREALKLMLQGTQRADLRAQGILIGLADTDDAVMRLGLAAALEGCPPTAEPTLARLLGHEDEEVRVLAIRVLATLRSKRARDLLLGHALAKKKWWRRTRLNAPSPEMVAAVRGLALGWARHPEAQTVLDLAGKSPHADVRAAAGLQ